MKKKALLQLMEQNIDAYHQHHPTTADMDLAIFRAHCAGKAAAVTASETPCSESTVYRAVRRVRKFLTQLDCQSWMDALYREIAAQEIHYGDWNAQSLLEMLYVAYVDCNNMDDSHARDGFANLYRLLDGLPERQLDTVYEAVCDLCLSHERAGFSEGVKVGFRLNNELGI